jgi:TonB family protein
MGTRAVTSSGFDGGDEETPKKRAVTSGGFDQTVVASAPRAVARVVGTPFEGIEILEKPRPVYSEEARRLRIEGTVQLRVVFGATGQIRVVSVVKGLGHGLDEAAVQAAESIRYRPARRDGRPIDAPAVIQIQFQIV